MGMPSLARTRSLQHLDIWTGLPGIVCVPQSLEYRVYDISTAVKLAAPVQIYPEAVGSVYPAASVNLTTDLINTAHYKASAFSTFLGTYAGTGRHRITWSYTYLAGDAKLGGSRYGAWFTPPILDDADDTDIMGPVEVSEEFDVIAGTQRLFGYCLPSDMRDEGLTITDIDDARLVKVIKRVSKLIERMTGRYFEPRYNRLLIDGTGSRELMLDEAICCVEGVGLASQFLGTPIDVTATDIRAYNRHLLNGLMAPDDRMAPIIELLGTDPPVISFVKWPSGTQNITITGVFGYTDPDPNEVSAVGVTPEDLMHACKLMVIREYQQMGSFDEREDRQRRHEISKERVQSYSVEYGRPGSGSSDPYGVGSEIGNILESFQRPMEIGAA